MEDIKISIVLPCYKIEKYLPKGLDSILSQSFSGWEAILVDDGSPDACGAICDEYVARDSRFRVFHTKNQGVSAARNLGQKEARGELIFFMDPDDYIEKNCLERCWEAYTYNPDADMIHFNRWYRTEEGDKRQEQSVDEEVVTAPDILRQYSAMLVGLSQEALYHYYKGEDIWQYKRNWQIWCFMFRRAFLERIRLESTVGLRMFEDAIYVTEATIEAVKIVRISDVLYNYVMHPTGALRGGNIPLDRIFHDKYDLIAERKRVREKVKAFDMHDCYIGSQVLSCLELALKLSVRWEGWSLFCRYVTDEAIRESIEKVDLTGAPKKFSLPCRLLKYRLHLALFAGCWILNKCGLAGKLN